MAHARTPDPPSLRLQQPEATARRLRTHFTRHNRRVLLFAAITLLSALGLWIVLYGLCCWLILLGAAAIDSPLDRIPRGFGIVFTVAALCAVIYAWIDRRLTPNERPADEKPAREILTDFLLTIPRMTLAGGGTLTAWQHISDADLTQAAAFLHRLAEKKRLPMSGVRLEIPDQATAVRLLFALQLTQVIDIHRAGAEFWLRLNPLRPETLRFARER